MAKLDSRGLRFRGWFVQPHSFYGPMYSTYNVFDNRDAAIQIALEAFPTEATFYVQEVNYFENHMEVDLGAAAIVSRIYPNRYFRFDVYERR